MKAFPYLIAAGLFALPAFAQNVGVSVSVGDPGFYGRIDIGDAPQPRILYREPIVVERAHVIQEPLYLRVPPGHAKHWNKHCQEYNACNRPVYFVRNDWYTNVYTPHYRKEHGHNDENDRGRGHDRNSDHEHGKGHKN